MTIFHDADFKLHFVYLFILYYIILVYDYKLMIMG